MECVFGIRQLMLGFALVALQVIPHVANGQVINTSVPAVGVSNSYSENLGTSFGFSIPGGRGPGSRVVGLNSLGQVQPNLGFAPGFGGAPGNGGGNFGFGVGGSGGGFNLGFNWAKGSQRSSVLNAPNLSVQNGFGGSIGNGQLTPFVTGVIPVVGSGWSGGWSGGMGMPGNGYVMSAPVDNAVTRAVRSGELQRALAEPTDADWRSEPTQPSYNSLYSSATRGSKSVSALETERENRIAAEQELIRQLLEEARTLVQQNNVVLARIKFREALQLVDDDSLRASVKAEIQATRE